MGAVAEKLGEVGLPEPVADLAARDWDAVVVGAGHNGLAAAAYLAKRDLDVLVLERRERVGGACTLERPFADPGYVVSPCAYVAGLLDKLVIAELELPRRGIEIRVADPELFIPFDDGTAFVQFLDEERTDAALREMGVSESRRRRVCATTTSVFDRARRLLRLGDRDAWVGESPKPRRDRGDARRRARSSPTSSSAPRSPRSSTITSPTSGSRTRSASRA